MTTINGPEKLEALADHHRFRFTILDEEGVSEVDVEISGTVMACEPDSLPYPLGDTVRTEGRSLVESIVKSGGVMPERFVVDSESVAQEFSWPEP